MKPYGIAVEGPQPWRVVTRMLGGYVIHASHFPTRKQATTAARRECLRYGIPQYTVYTVKFVVVNHKEL